MGDYKRLAWLLPLLGGILAYVLMGLFPINFVMTLLLGIIVGFFSFFTFVTYQKMKSQEPNNKNNN